MEDSKLQRVMADIKEILLTVPSGDKNGLAFGVLLSISLPKDEEKVESGNESVNLPECTIDKDTIDDPC